MNHLTLSMLNAKALNLKALTIAVAATLLLAGCSDPAKEAEMRMEQIRQKDAPPIPPLPEPERVEDFVYSAGDLRSPFLAPSLVNMQAQAIENNGVKPDVNRVREPLEEYELSQLIYRGKVVAPNGEEYGLVQLPDGYVRDVKVGEYMGKNDGRILEITPTQINLEEIVPDTRAGFVYKKTPLVTPN